MSGDYEGAATSADQTYATNLKQTSGDNILRHQTLQYKTPLRVPITDLDETDLQPSSRVK